MEVFVDGNRLEDEVAGAGSLKDALQHVQSNNCPSETIVIGIRCDGQEIAGDDVVNTLEKPASTVARLEVFTSTRETLVIDAMTQAAASLQESETICGRVVELLTKGQGSEAVKTLGECLRFWQQIHEAVGKSIQMLEIDLQKAMINDQPMLDVIAEPKQTLLQIKQALQAQDHVLLADVLQYELSEVTDRWFALIARIREEADERRQRQG